MKKFALICICVVVPVLMGGCGSSSYAPVDSWWDDTFALVAEHKDLLTDAILEIERTDGRIRSIAHTRRGTNFACPTVLGFEGWFYSSDDGRSPLENEVLLHVMEIAGVNSISVSARWGYIRFSLGGRGFGPNTSYFGFYFSRSGEMDIWRGTHGEGVELTPHGEGWIWREPRGDNIYFTERIAGHFFYYEFHF